MTIDEAKDELYRLLSDCVNNSYPIRNNTQKGRYRNAVKMAIASLEAWQKVLDELGYINMDIYTNEVKEIINKHLQEVQHG